MIIKIEDAPNIKHIKIDINFEDDNTEINITNDMKPIKPLEKTEYPSIMEDIALDTDETYNISNETVEKPAIPDIERKAKVSEDMENLEL